MEKTFAISAVILGLSLAACGGDGGPNVPDAGLDGTTGHPDGTDASIADTPSELGPSPDAPDVVEPGDAPLDRRIDGACPSATVLHGAACSVEGAKECGRRRNCTDVVTIETTECTCRNGRFVCGACPACNADLRNPGCGLGQVCDGVTFTRCDGSVFNVASTCSCSFGQSWTCDNDGGSYPIGACDAGADTNPLPDADGSSCFCSESDAGSWNAATVPSLACACQQFACPTYDVAVTQCPFVFDGSNNGLMLLTYTACNLVAVERDWGLDASTYVYDATTHELVGARYATDVNRFACGSATVFALQGGEFPLANCAVSTTRLCASDASTD